jgi:hypothetical protein
MTATAVKMTVLRQIGEEKAVKVLECKVSAWELPRLRSYLG